MKKLFLFFIVAMLVGCVDYTDDINAIDERLDALEQSVPSIEEQIESINAQLTSLKATDDAIKEQISELEKSDNATATEIADLKKKDSALEKSIGDLQKYVDTQITNAKSEAAAAYATVEQYNAIVAQLNALQSSTDKLGEELTAKINAEVKSLTNKIADLEARLKAVEDKVENLLARIQSVSYIPTYSDGKATLEYTGNESKVTLDFEISPKDAVAELEKVWDNAISIKAVYTQTRAVSFVDMPIINFEADAEKGVISVTASGENLSEEFFAGTQEASVALTISDGNNSVTSEYVPIIPLIDLPIFPETQKFDILAGEARGVSFNANMAWSVSLENDYYATLAYGDKTGVEVSGEAGDDIRVFVQVKENLKNYDADIVIPVAITMGNETKTLATFTIKQIERPDAIVVNEELPTTMTFEKDGHPSWGGEFPTAKEKYHLNYSDQWGLEGISMSCNLDGEYSIKVYAYNQTQSISDATTITEPWVSVLQFGNNGFKVLMDLTKQSAEWSWFEPQYESYVNFEDAEGNVLVSIFCTCTYKPAPSTGGDTPAESIVKLSQDTSTFVSGGHPSLGGEFSSAGVKYALTFGDEWACADGVSLKHSLEGVVAYKAYGYNAGFSIQEVNDSYITIDSDYGDGMFVIKMDTTAPMASSSFKEGSGYEGYVNLVDASDNIVASIYCLYNPSAQGGGSTSGDVVALVNATMASAVGVTLTAISETDADYDATFGNDYGVTGAPQYRLTYSQLGALTMPNYAALNISGFGSAQVMGNYNIGGDNWYGYQIFGIWNNPDAGGVVIEPNADYGFTAETIPNGKYPIAIYNTSYSPIARIVLDIK